MLCDKTYVILDTETTGFDPETHRVVEVAAVLVVKGRILTAMTSLVNPQRPIPPETSAIHGLTDADVADAPTLEELLPHLNAFISAADCLVAHNAPFDRSMLPGLAEKPWLDTLKLARHLHPELKSHKNGVLRYALNLRCPEAAGMPAHRALCDAYVTSRLLLRLLKDGEEKQHGITDIPALISLLETPAAPREPQLLEICAFGNKHRGSRWDQIPKDYLDWVANKAERVDVDSRFTAKTLLERMAAVKI